MGMDRRELLDAAATQLKSKVTPRMLEQCADAGLLPPVTRKFAGKRVYETRHLKAFVAWRQAVELRRQACAEKRAVAS